MTEPKKPNQPSETNQPQILTGKTTPKTAISSEPEPDWGTITTPEELAEAEDQAELEAICAEEETVQLNQFEVAGKRGLRMAAGGALWLTDKVAAKKLGGHFKSLEAEQYEPLFTEATDAAFDIMELEPESFIGKALNWLGDMDERYAPIVLLAAAIGDNFKAELDHRIEEARAQAKAERATPESAVSEAPPAERKEDKREGFIEVEAA